MSNTVFINLVGGPGCGKSTASASLYAKLKEGPLKVELLQDPVRDHIYKNESLMMQSQIPQFGELLLQTYSVNGKVDVCVRDTSLLNVIAYDAEDNPLFHSLVIQEYKKFTNIDFFIDRGDIPFDEALSIYTYDQSILLDQKIKDVYRFANIPLIEVNAITAAEQILEAINDSNV